MHYLFPGCNIFTAEFLSALDIGRIHAQLRHENSLTIRIGTDTAVTAIILGRAVPSPKWE